MKAFNIQTKKIIEVLKAEELIKGVIFPITDQQELGILETLNNSGFIYIEDNEVCYSGKYLKDHYWNEETKQWVFSQDLKEKRVKQEQHDIWEKIKERRLQAQSSGVLVKSIDKWVHTDPEAQRNYLFLKLVIDSPQFEPPYWKAMDGSYFKMTPQVYQEIVFRAYKKAQQDFATGDLHHKEMLKLDEPTLYDFDRWWSEPYVER